MNREKAFAKQAMIVIAVMLVAAWALISFISFYT
jgi:hypothetical protein